MSESKERIARMMDQVNGFDEVEARDFITGMMNDIKEPVKRIPENVFREIFLPVFIGNDPDLEKKTHEFTSHWAGVVGSISEPAEIVDVQGNKLFTVPPLFDTTLLEQESDPKTVGGYKKMFLSLQETAAVNPLLAQNEFSNAASEKLNRVIKSSEVKDNPWKEVFGFYGLIEKDEASAEPAMTPDLNDDFDFE